MKKSLLAVSGLFVVLAAVWLTSKSSEPTPENNITKVVKESSRPMTTASLPEKVETAAMALPETTPAIEPDAKPVDTLETPSATHEVADFEKGERFNILLKDGLQLGHSTNRMSSVEAPSLVGSYTSPEQKLPKTQDSISFNLETTMPDTASLTMEYRSRTEEGTWTTWHQLSPTDLGEWMLTREPTDRVQYRVTLYAQTLEETPVVHKIRMEARNSREVPPQNVGSVAPENQGSFTAIQRP